MRAGQRRAGFPARRFWRLSSRQFRVPGIARHRLSPTHRVRPALGWWSVSRCDTFCLRSRHLRYGCFRVCDELVPYGVWPSPATAMSKLRRAFAAQHRQVLLCWNKRLTRSILHLRFPLLHRPSPHIDAIVPFIITAYGLRKSKPAPRACRLTFTAQSWILSIIPSRE